MRKWVFFLAVLAAAGASAGATAAANPHDAPQLPGPMPTFQDQHSPGGVRAISVLQVPKGGLGTWSGDAVNNHGAGGGVSADADCGACITTCWYASGAYSGPSDWSGYARLNGWLSWCGNGSWVTYAAGGEYPTSSGWYSISYHNGAWWSGGCIGCGSIQMQDYMIWSWTAPLWGFVNSGTTWLTQTGYAWGGYST
jgi:hypothetical protein